MIGEECDVGCMENIYWVNVVMFIKVVIFGGDKGVDYFWWNLIECNGNMVFFVILCDKFVICVVNLYWNL